MAKNTSSNVREPLEVAAREALRVLSALPAVSERELQAAARALAEALGEE